MSELTRISFHPHDAKSLNHMMDDNQSIEPEYYVPIIPLILVKQRYRLND